MGMGGHKYPLEIFFLKGFVCDFITSKKGKIIKIAFSKQKSIYRIKKHDTCYKNTFELCVQKKYI